MADLEAEGFLSNAREYANLASFDIQKLPEDSVERQALHNLQNALDSLIQAVDALNDEVD
ncbi:hypothetical protein GCM10010988_02310 [Cnuibacter physcomitrellae]|uniref:Uncharacterized protein n=1 Tax=Cnuibacter physcomitrellae TaxID=1619308 RepID=A0A1X9LJ23_9MICO|nr:hypothetical protein [Cnuibacter physcomitrellae]ARJ05173.1 hypothetical protein B5808_08095 [Cnuibacter physcomitrellae]MCS5498651.1 hypothetical protein [Cnuibacter physcomitrellae]GGI35115.1 hypothetical protein GCM10010988_02310 [Cnuibacter physcomitrellae]